MIFSQPFPLKQPSANVLWYTFSAGFIVFLILILFQPFGFSNTPSASLLLFAIFFGVATFVVTSVNALLLPLIFPGYFRESRWTAGREMLVMLWHVVAVSFANCLLMNLLYGDKFGEYQLLKTLWITAAVGIFPVTIIVLLKQQSLLKKYTAEAAILDQTIQTSTGDADEEDLVKLTGENQGEVLSINLSNLRYISAADNYVKIFYTDNHQLLHKVLRSTLKRTGQQLQDHESVFRCHRAYIINLSRVRHVTGNAQGYKLHLDDVEQAIPVSRSLNSTLSGLLQRHRPFPSPQ